MALIFNYWLLEVTVLLVTALLLFYSYFRNRQISFWANRNVPYAPTNYFSTTIFGASITSMSERMAELYHANKKEKALGYWFLGKPTLLAMDLGLIKKILVRDFAHFHDRIPFIFTENDPLSGHLFNLPGQAWRNLRVKLTPTFTSGRIKTMYSIMEKVGKRLQEFIIDHSKSTDIIVVKDMLDRFTTNIIASTAFGVEIDTLSDPDHEFRKQGKKVLDPPITHMIWQVLGIASPKLKKLLNITEIPKECHGFYCNLVKEVITFRRENNVQRNDFMQLLLQLIDKGRIEDVDKPKDGDESTDQVSDSKFTIEQAAAQAFLFFIAGFETSSATMTLALYELAKNQDIQLKLKQEIKSALKANDGDCTYEAITGMKYLDLVVQETLRKYPVVGVLIRVVTKEYNLEEFDCTLPVGTMVLIPLFGIARDPDIFAEPEKFDPNRFLPENVIERDKFSSIPFGEGPRNCIGNRFGLLQAKIGLVSILSKFTVDICEETPKILHFIPKSFSLNVVGGMPLKFSTDN